MLSETTRKGEITRDVSIDTERCKGENQALGPQHVEIVQEGRIRQQETEKEQLEGQRKTGGEGENREGAVPSADGRKGFEEQVIKCMEGSGR